MQAFNFELPVGVANQWFCIHVPGSFPFLIKHLSGLARGQCCRKSQSWTSR